MNRKFKDDMSMSQDEIDKFVRWVDGAPKLDWAPVRMTKWKPQERKY